ncbi:MAG: tRNA (guanosine(46)-N7)-methyltransferase TrmB [Defluviitaleaceae bacterium]|nr:tRNA (guanosine(46)-N7)-methyltransferase TrmB [Defluviitaleaceae bacterium]
MRARKKKWATDELNENELIVDNARACKGSWEQVFGNTNPIYLEIGCGMGSFIVENAKKYSNINFIGLEREKMVIVSGARKVREYNETMPENLIGNVRFVMGDAAGLNEIFAANDISRIYLNFSDPWGRRKKWAKRRLTHRNFLNIYKEILGNKKELFLKTDSSILFEFSLNEFIDNGLNLRNISLDLHNSPWAENNILTEYEAKFAAKGMPIYRVEAYWGC